MPPHQNLWVDLVEKLPKPPSTQGLWLGEGLHFLGVTKPSTGSSSLFGTFRCPGRPKGCKCLQRRRPMPGVDFQAVRSLVSIAQVLERIGFVPAECSGDQVRGPCPVHGSNSPKSRSFSANPARNAYQCFKCGSTGNQLDLWAAVTKTDLYTAAIDLCEKFHLDVPWVRKW